MSEDIDIQRRYYAETAQRYDAMHLHEGEHAMALCVMLGTLDLLGVTSILDIGAGTGRTLRYIKQKRPDVRVCGIEPVEELRHIAFSHGVSSAELTSGDALAIPYDNDSFDLVCAFAMLHHVRTPERAVAEILRVARKAVFISDANSFGQGSPLVRALKQGLNSVALWPLADWIKTRGRGYTISEGDGLAYSYSLFTNYRQIREVCNSVHVFNTSPAGINPYRSSGHVALLGVKR